MAIDNRIGTTNNLTNGGKYDLLFLEFPEGYPESQLKFSFTSTPRKITGVQKVAQTFLYCLLTQKGVDPLKPSFGTDFVKYIKTGNRPTVYSDIVFEVEQYIEDAASQAKAILNPVETDKNSMLKSVTILGIESSGESLDIYVDLLTQSGKSAPIAIPFPQLNLELTTESNGQFI